MSLNIELFILAAIILRVYAQVFDDESQKDEKDDGERICYSPGSNLNTKYDIQNDLFPVSPNSVAQYYCTESVNSLKMLPEPTYNRTCLSNGSWSGEMPICVYSLNERLNNTVDIFSVNDEMEYNCSIDRLYECQLPESNFTLQIYLSEPTQIDAIELEASEELDAEVEGHELTEKKNILDENNENITVIWFLKSLAIETIMKINIYNPQNKTFILERLNVLSQTGSAECGYPDAKPISVIIIEEDMNYTPNVVEYNCPEGYDLSGIQMRQCQKDGSWSHEAPYCTKDFSQSVLIINASIAFVVAIVIASAAFILCKKKQSVKQLNERNKAHNDIASFDSELLESTGELYEEISLEKLTNWFTEGNWGDNLKVEPIDRIQSNNAEEDPSVSKDKNILQETKLHNPLPTLAEERNSLIQDQVSGPKMENTSKDEICHTRLQNVVSDICKETTV